MPVLFLFFILSEQAITYSIILSFLVVEPPVKKGCKAAVTSTNPKPLVSYKKTPKKAVKASLKTKSTTKDAEMASPAHQVNDLDKTSGLDDKRPPKVGPKGDIRHDSDGTQTLDSKDVAITQESVDDSDDSDASVLNKKP
jgi:hypothetical protein